MGNWNKELGRNGCDSLSRPGIPFGCRLVMAQRDPAAQRNLPGINLTKGEVAAGGGIMVFACADIAVNRLLNLTLEFFPTYEPRSRIVLMSRVLGRGNGYELRMIHNVRPAVELPGSSRWTALTVTFGILIVSAALLLIALRS